MPLHLHHTIVPAYDKVKSAEFIARMFGLKYEGPWGHFAPVKVNDILTLDFDDSDNPRSNHYAFLAADEEFDAILQRIKDEKVAFGSGPRSRTDGEINHLHQGLGFYFECENGHVWECYYAHVCYGLAGGVGVDQEMLLAQRPEHLPRLTAVLPDIVLEYGVLTAESVLVPQQPEDALDSVALLLGNAKVAFQDRVDDVGERLQLGAPGVWLGTRT